MRTISVTNARLRFAAILDAAQREPVIIHRNQRDVAVVLSMAQYERLRSINVAEFQVICDRIADAARKRGKTEEALADVLCGPPTPPPL